MKLVELSNTKIAIEPIYIDQPKDESLVLVFLHEALGSIGQWKSFPQQLCKALGLNGIVYERSGHGQSSPLKGKRDKHYLHQYAWEELPELLNTILPPEKKVVLVGHSDGGSIALLYAAKFPARVKALVSMAAHVLVEDITLKGIEPAVKAFEAGKLEGLKRYHGEKTTDLFYAWAKTWNLPEFRDWNLCKDIETITCPVLALQGVNDQYGSELQLELIKSSIHHENVSTFLIPNCGHHPHLEMPKETENHIQNWGKSLF